MAMQGFEKSYSKSYSKAYSQKILCSSSGEERSKASSSQNPNAMHGIQNQVVENEKVVRLVLGT